MMKLLTTLLALAIITWIAISIIDASMGIRSAVPAPTAKPQETPLPKKSCVFCPKPRPKRKHSKLDDDDTVWIVLLIAPGLLP